MAQDKPQPKPIKAAIPSRPTTKKQGDLVVRMDTGNYRTAATADRIGGPQRMVTR